jgi:CHAD domain-containing protein
MRPDQPIDLALRAAVDRQVRKVRKRLDEARAGDADGIHDGRVAVRRLREDLEVMGETVFDRVRVSEISDRLHDVEKALAGPRDADVMLEGLEAYVAHHRSQERALTHVTKLVERRRARTAKSARKEIDRARSSIRASRKLARRSSLTTTPRSRPSPRLVEHFVHEAIWRAYDAVLAHGASPTNDVEALHAFRSDCRRLRYAIELFEGALGETRPLIARLTRVQDEIGEMHDQQVAARRIEKWMRSGKLSPTPALESLVADLRRRRDAMRQGCLERKAEVLSSEFRASLHAALERARPARASSAQSNGRATTKRSRTARSRRSTQ